MSAHDSRIRLGGCLALSLLSVSSGSCYKLDDGDCKITGCDKTLLEAYRTQAPPGCAACLQRDDECRQAFKLCNDDPACSAGALCLLRPDRITYQDCLAGLRGEGLSSPNDPRGAWEGQTQLIHDCMVKDPCLTACKRNVSDWSCIGKEPYETPVQLINKLAFSVKLFDSNSSRGEAYEPIANVDIRLCAGFGCPKTSEAVGTTTREDGTAELPLKRQSPNQLRFELTDREAEPRFPRTIYYPGRIGSLPLQPLAIYLVPTRIVGFANQELIDTGGVLMDAGQTLILPDACREQDTPAATHVTLRARVDGTLLEQCADAAKPADDAWPPCVWYADPGGPPSRQRRQMAGFGGGVVGLPPNKSNTFYVCDGTTVVSRLADVEIAGGTLTIMRMSPLTAAEKILVEQEEKTLGNPCESQVSPPRAPEASAN